MSSSQRVPRPRCWRERVQSVSPGRTTMDGGEGDPARGRGAAGKRGCTAIRGSAGRTGEKAGGTGCMRRRENGSTRRVGADGMEGTGTTKPRWIGAEGFEGTKIPGDDLAEGFGSGARIFGAASSG